MNLKDYEKKVQVLMVPQTEPVTSETLFLLETRGLTRHYGLAELDIADVPAAFLEQAHDFLNGWATYQIRTGRTIKVGERVQNGGSPVVYRAEPSPQNSPTWAGLRLTVAHVHFQCQCEKHMEN